MTMQVEIDSTNHHGRTYVRTMDNTAWCEVEISTLKNLNLEQGKTYPMGDFPLEVQKVLAAGLAQAAEKQRKDETAARAKEMLISRTKYSWISGTKYELFSPRSGKLKGIDPDLIISFTNGGGYVNVFFNGYVEGLEHFENADDLLNAVFGTHYNNGVILTKKRYAGRIIGSGGRNIKGLSSFVGFRLKVETYE